MSHFPIICIVGSALVLYFIAALLYSGGLFSRLRFHGRFGTLLAWLGFTCHTGALIAYRLLHGGLIHIFDSALGSFLFFGWVLVGVYLLVEWRIRTKALGAIALSIGLFTMLIGAIIGDGPVELSRALQGQMILLHVVAVIIGYASFAVAFCASVIYLIEHRMLKTKRIMGVFERLPALDRTDDLASKMVSFGFPLLTLGLALGIFRAVAVGANWTGDLKVISSGLIWLIYGIYVVSRRLLGWTGKRMHYLLIVGFAFIVAAYIGGTALGPEFHGIRFLGQGVHP